MRELAASVPRVGMSVFIGISGFKGFLHKRRIRSMQKL
jgi:malic enzyme